MTFFICLGVGIAVIGYFLLFHDDVMEKRLTIKNALIRNNQSEKIAKVKALSSSWKEIEKFILDNASTLSDQTIDILIARMENLEADRVIRGDDLKSRIADLSDEEEIPEEAGKKVTRKRK